MNLFAIGLGANVGPNFDVFIANGDFLVSGMECMMEKNNTLIIVLAETHTRQCD